MYTDAIHIFLSEVRHEGLEQYLVERDKFSDWLYRFEWLGAGFSPSYCKQFHLVLLEIKETLDSFTCSRINKAEVTFELSRLHESFWDIAPKVREYIAVAKL